MVARPWSCRQAATISAALAVRSSMSTTISAPLSKSPGVACLVWRADVWRRSLVVTIVPSCRKRSQTPTAASNKPPGFPLRSSTKPDGGVSEFSVVSTSAISELVPSPNRLTLIMAIPGSPSSHQFQWPSASRLSPWMLATDSGSREMVIARELFSGGVTTSRRRLVPSGPRSFSATRWRLRSATGSPLIARIRSPAISPAWQAGPSGTGATTTTPRGDSTVAISTPMPAEASPRVSFNSR